MDRLRKAAQGLRRKINGTAGVTSRLTADEMTLAKHASAVDLTFADVGRIAAGELTVQVEGLTGVPVGGWLSRPKFRPRGGFVCGVYRIGEAAYTVIPVVTGAGRQYLVSYEVERGQGQTVGWGGDLQTTAHNAHASSVDDAAQQATRHYIKHLMGGTDAQI